jgi:hypothetical protein
VEEFQFFLLLLLFFPDRPYQCSDITDVVCQCDAAKGLNKYQDNSLIIVMGRQISKSYSEHDIGPPVVPPDIFYIPLSIDYINFNPPAILD